MIPVLTVGLVFQTPAKAANIKNLKLVLEADWGFYTPTNAAEYIPFSKGEKGYIFSNVYSKGKKPEITVKSNKPSLVKVQAKVLTWSGKDYNRRNALVYTAKKKLQNTTITFTVSAKASNGKTLSKSMKIHLEQVDASEEIHECKHCIEGEISRKGEISASATFFKAATIKATFSLPPKRVWDFYYSMDYGEFGLTVCPHRKYKVSVSVRNENDRAIAGANIVVESYYAPENASAMIYGTEKANMNGEAEFFLSGKTYRISAEMENGRTISKKVKIGKKAKKVVLRVSAAASEEGENQSFFEKKFAAVKTSADMAAAIDEYGNLYTWGVNFNSQLGQGEKKENESYEHQIILKDVSEVILGRYQAHAAIKKNGDLYMWGWNDRCQIGNGVEDAWNDPKVYPTPIKIFSNVEKFYFMGNGCAVITRDGDLYTWGENSAGNVGDGTTEKRSLPVKVFSNVEQFFAMEHTSLAITKDHKFYIWGQKPNFHGLIRENAQYKSPEFLYDGIKQFYGDGDNYHLLTTDGKLYTWGRDWHYYGDGTTERREYKPIKVMNGIREIVRNGMVISNDGDLYTWGYNYDGVLGNGTNVHQALPVKILSDVETAKTYDNNKNRTVITKDGDLYIWGSNKSYEIGDGTQEDVYTPKKVLSDVVSVDIKAFSMAVTKEGTLFVWGKSYIFPVSVGTVIEKPTPVPVNTLSSGKKLRPEKQYKKQKKSISGLSSGILYNYYVVKTKETEELFSEDNLLYIGQETADENGNLEVDYELSKPCETPVFFAVGSEKTAMENVEVSLGDIVYTGEEKKITPVLSYDGKELTEGIDYEMEGDFSVSKAGEYTVIFYGLGEYDGVIQRSFTVKAESSLNEDEHDDEGNSSETNTSLKKPSKVTGLSVKNQKGKKILVKWKAQSGVSGYQIQYALNKKFTKQKKTKNVSKSAKKKTLTGLKKGKKYYVRVRAFRKKSGKTKYGSYSTVKSVKIKK